jgi:site-specific recombinase XerD
VQHVILPSGRRSWTVTSEEGLNEPVDRFLAHLDAIERSPNTVRAYAHDLRDFFEFLTARGLAWDRVRLEDIGRFIAWLRVPASGRSEGLSLLPSADGAVTASTVNRKLSALASFYEFHSRHGVDLGELLTRWRPAGRSGGSWKPFLAHLGPRMERHQVIKLKAGRHVPRSLSESEEARLLAACERLRDQLLLKVMRRAGLRIGEALGLRHEDLDARRSEVAVVARDNANGARAKTWGRRVPVEAALIRLYSDYLHEEYGAHDSDYVFINLRAERFGSPMTYAGVDRLVRTLRTRSGVHFTPHWLRHSYATDLLRRKVPIEVVAKLLGHSSITTTADIYNHLGVEDARRELVAAGLLDARRALVAAGLLDGADT